MRVKADHREPTREALTKQRPASYKQRRKKRKLGANLGQFCDFPVEIAPIVTIICKDSASPHKTCLENFVLNSGVLLDREAILKGFFALNGS